MKSDVFSFDAKSNNERALSAIKNFASITGFSANDGVTLRLLSEEMMTLLNSIVKYFGGEIWVENNKSEFEIHSKITGSIGDDDKEKLLEITDGINVGNKGMLCKICVFLADILTYEPDNLTAEIIRGLYPSMSYGMGGTPGEIYFYTWSLAEYQKKISEKENRDEWCHIEKSVIMNMADDIVIAIKVKRFQ